MSSPQIHPHGELHNVDTAHEETDINIRAIIGFIVVLTVITLGIQVAMIGVFKVLNIIEAKEDPAISPLGRQAPARPADFPEPHLQTTPWTDLRKLKADEFSYLHGYGWVDQQAGVARVPIETAKALLLQRGLPVRPELADASEGTRVAATGESSGGRNLAAGGADKSAAAPGGAAQGAQGAQGASGAQGAGAQGARGARGAQGAGAQGARGAHGAGAPGASGAQGGGAPGATGAQGAAKKPGGGL